MGEPISIYEAKTHLSKLVSRAEAGEEITISRNGRPAAQLVPLAHRPARRTFGAWEGRVRIADDFDDFTEQDAKDWYSE